jgi:hypothetical protein
MKLNDMIQSSDGFALALLKQFGKNIIQRLFFESKFNSVPSSMFHVSKIEAMAVTRVL